MIAYFYQTKKVAELIIVAAPCNGPELMAGKRVAVSGKREALAYCKANGVTPHNF
jgi:hypothetical protein